MKKYLLSFIMVLLLTLTTSVYAANTCDTYGTQSCPERDDYKNYCMIGSNGQCTYKKKYVKCTEPGDAGCDCSTFGQSDCTKMFNSDGKACDIVNGVCTVAASGSSRDIEYNQPDNPTPDQPTDGYDNYEADGDVVCGKGWVFNRSIANVTHYMVLLFQIIAPVMLIILGMIDLLKGIVAGKDDELNRNGEPTGRLCVKTIIPKYGGKVDLVPMFVVNEKAINAISNYWNAGDTMRAVGKLDFSSTTETIKEEVDFGEPIEKTRTISVSDLIITGGSNTPLDGEMAYDYDEIKTACDERLARLEELKNKASEPKKAPAQNDYNNLGF